MKHFVGYHSTAIMGYELRPDGKEYGFYSQKSRGYLENTIGNRVWMIGGSSDSKQTIYRLVGYYIADEIRKSKTGKFNVIGTEGVAFEPPIQLNDYDWFQTWLKSKFYSFGLHEIRLPNVIAGLEQLTSRRMRKPSVARSKSLLPEEVELKKSLPEGAVREITVNEYERNVKARKLCIKHYGLDCHVCGFNFHAVYGDAGVGLIHVHHLKPLTEIREGYEVDPIEDLRPVCPNCHAIIHCGTPVFTIEEVRKMLERQR